MAGLLMFGKTESITDEACAPHFFPDYRECGEKNSDPRWLDRIYPDGTWNTNLFQFYKRVLPKLQEILPVPFHLEGDTRIDETPAHVAVREALINTLIHADYSINASIVITRSKSRIVFSNPGCLLVSKQQFYDGGDSVCRNLALQKMFMMFGKAEKAGSGADKIITGWKESNWSSPMLEEKYRPDKVILTLPLISMLDNPIKDKLVNMFGERVLVLGHDKVLTLAFAVTEGVVSNERLRYTLNMHRSDISKMLKELCTEGYLVSNGRGRGTTYQLNTEEKPTSSEENLTSSEEIGKRKNCRKEELFDMIMECASDWISLGDIARKIGRNPQYLKSSVINMMVREGLLLRKFPIPNHPAQKYKRAGRE